MEELKPKTFWERPEGTTGALILAVIVIGGGYILYKMLPAIIVLMENTLYAVLMGIALFAIIYIVLDRRSRTLVWYLYKMFMRWLTGLIITIDPIKILESYIDHLKESLEKMNAHITQLKQEIRKLKDVIDKNVEEMNREFSVAKKAKEKSDSKTASLSVRQAERLKKSNESLSVLLDKLTGVYNMLTRVFENANYLLKDTENEVDIRKREYAAIQAGHSAFKSAMKVISGDSDKMEIFNMSMDKVTSEISQKIGEMERFMELSSDALARVDLENAVFEEAGFVSLEEWEKQSTLLKDKPGPGKSTSKSKYSDLF
jgi:formiminotetrahydrofolate cyclodeaminase